MALPRAVTRGLLFLSFIAACFILFNLSRNPSSNQVWDASSWADRRSHTFGLGMEENPNLFPGLDRGSSSGWGLFGGRKSGTPPRPERPYRDSDFAQAPRPLSRPSLNPASNSSYPRVAPGKSRIVIAGSDPEQFEEGPLPNLAQAFEHLKPMLMAVKERHPQIPREHMLWEPIFSPAVGEELQERYWHLRENWDEDKKEWVMKGDRRWMLVTVCRQVAGMLADWFAMWTVLADFLGPETLVFSLLEGGSDDGSGQILSEVMRDHLLYLGVPPANIHIRTLLPPLDWESAHRIELLAQMRNAGMKPLYDSAPEGLSPDGKPWTAVIYYNDVYLSGNHFLELMHQHFMQDADMTCGWDHAGRWFYDGWVGRDMSGDLYTPFPVKEEDKDLPQKLFLSSPRTKQRFDRLLPFQVFAGWNGIAVMNPRPFFPPYNVRFRRGTPKSLLSMEWECQASESSFISWDFWKYGFGRVQVVPGVHACYGKEDAMMRGWVEWPQPEEGFSEMIDWQDEPPAKVRCHDWPDKPGKGYWAWDTVRWVDPPKLERPRG